MTKKFIWAFALLFTLILVGCTDKETANDAPNWNESSLFQAGSYTMIGKEGRLGFVYDDTEAIRFYPNKVQKYMWHFWGNKEELTGAFKVVGVHETGTEEIIVVPTMENSFLSPNNGADNHIPTNMSLPKSGVWRLDAYFGEQRFGSVYVKVYE